MFFCANYRLLCSCLHAGHFTLKRRLHVMHTLVHIYFDHSLELTVRAGRPLPVPRLVAFPPCVSNCDLMNVPCEVEVPLWKIAFPGPWSALMSHFHNALIYESPILIDRLSISLCYALYSVIRLYELVQLSVHSYVSIRCNFFTKTRFLGLSNSVMHIVSIFAHEMALKAYWPNPSCNVHYRIWQAQKTCFL